MPSITRLNILSFSRLGRANEVVLAEVLEVLVVWAHLQILLLSISFILFKQRKSVRSGVMA